MLRFYHRKMITYMLKTESEAELKEALMTHYSEEDTREDAIVFLCDKEGTKGLAGWTNYHCLKEKDVFISKEIVVAGDTLWEKARRYLKDNPEEEILVVDAENNPLTFCYLHKSQSNELWPRDYELIMDSVEVLGKDIPVSLLEIFPGTKNVLIFECNELVWRVYKALENLNIDVKVFGEEWRWFNVNTSQQNQSAISNESIYIYAEGAEHTKYKNSVLTKEYVFLVRWQREIFKELLKKELLRIKNLGVETCVVSIPQIDKLDYSACSRGDLLNLLSPLQYGSLSKDLEIKKRQKDFYDAKVFERMELGKSHSDEGWRTVLFGDVPGSKREVEHKRKRLYLLGPCIVQSIDSSPEESLGACLQNLAPDYELVKMVVPVTRVELVTKALREIPLHKQDVVIYVERVTYLPVLDERIGCVDLVYLYNRPRKETWFRDCTLMHVNAAANKAIAKEIYAVWLKHISEESSKVDFKEWIQKGELLSSKLQKQVAEYVEQVRNLSIQEQEKKVIGAIVMNCNPFTKGHLYLIETAAKQVDFLYVFIVQEDKSTFPFKIRQELVKRGTEHISNLAVVPSGEFVLSYMTLPVYFEKALRQEEKVDAYGDIEIFARYIAPQLNITKRFVGEEPTDLVTRQYNEQMQEVLPEFGVEFVEIPRTTSKNGQIISASKVRKLLLEEQWDELKMFVPDTTYGFLKKIKQMRVVIYGAGNYGKKARKFLHDIGGMVVGWLDKKYESFAADWNVESPKILASKEYDIIIVAVINDDIYKEIVQELLEIDESAKAKIVRLF